MARHKDENWKMDDGPVTWDIAKLAVLMDIRDELKRLNCLLHCSNFIDIPKKLDRIARQTNRKRKPVKARKLKVVA